MNLDVSLVHGHCQSDRSSSQNQHAAKLGDKSGFEYVSGGSSQEPDTVQNLQTGPIEASTREPGTGTTEKLSISDVLTSESNCGSLSPHNLGCSPECMVVEYTLKQKHDIGTKSKLAESESQDPDCTTNELRASSEDVKSNSAYEQVSLQSKSKVGGSALGHLEADPVNEFENPTIEPVEPVMKDIFESASLTVGPENKKPSLLLSESAVDETNFNHLDLRPVSESENTSVQPLEYSVKDIIVSAFTVGEENEKPAVLLGKSDGLGVNATEDASFKSGLGDKEPHLSLDKTEDVGLAPENNIKSTLGDLGSSKCSGTDNPSTAPFEPSEKVAIESTGHSELNDKGAPLQSKKRKFITRSPVNSSRVLRSRSKEKPEPSKTNNVVTEVPDDANKKRKMRKKKRRDKNTVNEFSRIRSHLRYLLHRIKYEQNLIEAYSGEGWKGQSLEKIKPEKELQRAKSHILRYKLKIRDLFHHLDLSFAQGQLPESLFDSQGEIDSEDIFCAKCGSKDLPDNNDIILCDGACERGFHQFCLEPPLLREYIPPGDEGWLCPGCDCKLDCFDLLNDFHGTKLSLVDSWEKVFPEAAAAASGKTLEDGSGFPSDDSEDDDYNPGKPELDESLEGDESSSDESNYVSEPDGLGASADNKQYMRLPSDDSEDDDFDPHAADHDEQVKPESSSSDFSSDSEDLGAIFDDNTSLGEDQDQASHDTEKLEVVGVKCRSLRDELSYLLDSDVAPISGRRQVERLDYKRLHDENYGNVSSDSSDEDYKETAGEESKKRNSRRISGERSPVAESKDGVESEDYNQKGTEHTPKRAQKKHDVEDENKSSTSHRSSSGAGPGNKSTNRQYKKLGEVVTQRLFESFKENQYPKRPEKENLAKELGLTIQQVSKWFENARWSSRHSATMGSNVTTGRSSGQTSSLHPNQKSLVTKRKTVGEDAPSNKVVSQASVKPYLEANPVKVCQNADVVRGTMEGGTSKSRKRKGSKTDDQISDQNTRHEKTSNKKSHTPTNHQVRRSRRLQLGSSRTVS